MFETGSALTEPLLFLGYDQEKPHRYKKIHWTHSMTATVSSSFRSTVTQMSEEIFPMQIASRSFHTAALTGLHNQLFSSCGANARLGGVEGALNMPSQVGLLRKDICRPLCESVGRHLKMDGEGY